MPRQIDQQSLDIISGRASNVRTQSLLDNTLATMTNKMQQREAQQVAQLRQQKIKQGAMELMELEKMADVRAMENEKRRRRAQFEVANQDQILENELHANSVKRAETEVAGTRAIAEKLVSSPNDETFKQRLQQNKGLLAPEMYESYSNVNWDNPQQRAQAMESIISDVDYEQRKRMEQIKANANAAKAGSESARGAPFNAGLAEQQLKQAGVAPGFIGAISNTTYGLADRLRLEGYSYATNDRLNAIAIDLLKQNPDKYVSESGGLLGFNTDKDLRHQELSDDIEAKFRFGYTVNELDMIAARNGTTREKVIETLNATR